MFKWLDFPVFILAVALAAYVLAGGLGLLLTGLLGFVWKGGPFHTAWHGAVTVTMPEAIRKIQERQAKTLAARPQHYFLFEIGICVVLIVLGILRMESKGLLGPIG